MSWQPKTLRAERPSACEGSAGIGRPPVLDNPPPHVVLGEGIAYVSAQLERVQRELDAVRRALGQPEA